MCIDENAVTSGDNMRFSQVFLFLPPLSIFLCPQRHILICGNADSNVRSNNNNFLSSSLQAHFSVLLIPFMIIKILTTIFVITVHACMSDKHFLFQQEHRMNGIDLYAPLLWEIKIKKKQTKLATYKNFDTPP